MTELVFDPDMPRELQDAVRPYLERWLWVAPTWCHTVLVDNIIDVPSNQCGENTTLVQYREARISIAPNWLEQPPGRRESMVLHELMHIPFAPAGELLIEASESTNNEAWRELLENQWRKAIEGAVQDLTHALMKNQDLAA